MNDLFTLFTARLRAAGIDHMVTGSVAAIVYGEPRLTHDIDLVVVLPDSAIDALISAFPDAEFYCAPREVIVVEAHRRQRGHFNIIHHESGFKADVYIAGTDVLHRWAFSRRRELPFAGTTMDLAPPEYVILRKLEFFREGGSEKHIGDIRGILRHQGRVDLEFIEGEVERRGLRREWDAVRAQS